MSEKNSIQKTLIDELGLTDLSQEKQEELLAKMTEVVLKRIFVETMDKLTERDQEAYADLIEKNANPEEVEKFLTEKISGYNEMVKKVVDDFKEEMINK
jgi:hypothetical protein